MAAWATHEDVTALWVGPPIGPAVPTGVDDQMDTLCLIAEYKVKRAFPKIQDRIDADLELAELAKYVVVQMVQSLYQNPLGLQYFQQQSGPFAKSGNYAAGATVLMKMSDEQRDLLAPASSGAASMLDLDPNRDSIYPYPALTPDVVIN